MRSVWFVLLVLAVVVAGAGCFLDKIPDDALPAPGEPIPGPGGAVATAVLPPAVVAALTALGWVLSAIKSHRRKRTAEVIIEGVEKAFEAVKSGEITDDQIRAALKSVAVARGFYNDIDKLVHAVRARLEKRNGSG